MTTPRHIAGKPGLGGHGWVPDLPDVRDHPYVLHRDAMMHLPEAVDLEHHCVPVYTQGNLGSCTANAISAALAFIDHDTIPPSRLFIYYNERVIRHTTEHDSGAHIRDGIKAVARKGVCSEHLWAYDIKKFADPPPEHAYEAARKTKAISYRRLPRDLKHLKGCLAEGFPFVFGFTVYEYFEDEDVRKTGVVRLPTKEDNVAGGHAAMVVGYDDRTRRFRARNSWGPHWGQGGYFTIPYGYLTDHGFASDYWTIRRLT